MDGVIGLFFIVSLFVLYLAPTFIAAGREHHNWGAIIVINLFLGWTFIGWVVALAMACGEVRKPVRA